MSTFKHKPLVFGFFFGRKELQHHTNVVRLCSCYYQAKNDRGAKVVLLLATN